MRAKILAGLGFALLLASPAQAAKCYIGEYNAAGVASGIQIQVAAEPHVASQVTSDFAGGAVQSNSFNAATSFIRLWCDTQASYLVGTNPTAAATDNPVAALVPEYFSVPVNQGYKLSVHTNP